MISRIELVVNVAFPMIVIATASVVSLVRLVGASRRSNQASAQPEVVVVDSESQYIRSTSIAQLCASLTFLALGLPAHVHELSVMLAGRPSAPVGLETYMTQRLLLVVLYSRYSSTFVVHFAANRVFRRRLTAVLRRRCRRRPACCGRGRRADAPGDISLSSVPTWSHAADGGDNPPADGSDR